MRFLKVEGSGTIAETWLPLKSKDEWYRFLTVLDCETRRAVESAGGRLMF